MPRVDMPLGRIAKRTTLQDSIYAELRASLMRGHFDPGQALIVQSLAETLHTSTMPVRGALMQLASENALHVLPTGTTQVPHVSIAKLQDLRVARIALEGLAGELACARITAAQLRELKRNIEEHERAIEHDGLYPMLDKNQEFHFLIYRASQSTVLPHLIENLWLQFGPYMRVLSKHIGAPAPKTFSPNGTNYHYLIVAGLKKKDPIATRRAIEDDINRTVDLLMELLTADAAAHKFPQ
jgi:DNA-binding GntR family transcriptional regulator